MARSRRWNDEKVEVIIGKLLRVGVLTAAAVVLAGGVWYLFSAGGAMPQYRAFRGEPSRYRSLPGVLGGLRSLDGPALIQFGLLLLIATPIVRVAFSLVAFVLERDRAYVCITLIVLGILLYSLVGGH